MKMKFQKTEIASRGKKLFPPKDGNRTNPRLTDRTSKLTCKKADNSLAEKGSLGRLIS